MKKTVSMAITMLLVLTSIFAMSGCWNQGISQEDFMLEIDKVVVDGNKVKVETSFHNSSLKFVKVISRGSEEDVSSIIFIELKDKDGQPEYDYPDLAVTHIIAAKSIIGKTQEFKDLASGEYTVKVFVNIIIEGRRNNGGGVKKFSYSAETNVEVK